MKTLTTGQVRQRIAEFLRAQFDKKTASEQKKLAKAEENNDVQVGSDLRQRLTEAEQKYSLDVWMEHAAKRMAAGLKFGTHLSKGVHPDSRGDNIFFQPEHPLPVGLIASQHMHESALDANGNAAYLPLAAFFDWFVDEEKEIRIRHLILVKHPALAGAFAADAGISSQHQERFFDSLTGETGAPATAETNKQVLWPLKPDAGPTDNASISYICLIPLYPSAFTHALYNRLNAIRYSEENKKARENRYKQSSSWQAYVSIPQQAGSRLGGTKPQNVSQLDSKRGGRNLLLPSMPPTSPTFAAARPFAISAGQASFFDNRMSYLCRAPLQELFALVADKTNTFLVRESRKTIINRMLDQVLWLAASIQGNSPPGWSKKAHDLHYNERLWLDPGRAELEGEEDFAEDREQEDWRGYVATRFANWLNALLKKEFENMRFDFGDAVQKEWRATMEEIIQKSRREGREVFL